MVVPVPSAVNTPRHSEEHLSFLTCTVMFQPDRHTPPRFSVSLGWFSLFGTQSVRGTPRPAREIPRVPSGEADTSGCSGYLWLGPPRTAPSLRLFRPNAHTPSS